MKRVKEDTYNLSEWINVVWLFIQIRIKELNGSTNTHATSILKKQKW